MWRTNDADSRHKTWEAVILKIFKENIMKKFSAVILFVVLSVMGSACTVLEKTFDPDQEPWKLGVETDEEAARGMDAFFGLTHYPETNTEETLVEMGKE